MWIAIAVVALIGPPVTAETSITRLSPYFRDSYDNGFETATDVSDVMARLGRDMQYFARGVSTCADLMAVPLGKERTRDPLRDTMTVIQTIRVECWALSMMPVASPLAVAAIADRIEPDQIKAIMDNARQLAVPDGEWAKTLITFSGGEIDCRHAWRCRLSLPDGRNPPEQSLDFDLMLAFGEDRFIRVVQMVYGRSGFVYGVRWRPGANGGEVVAIYPDLSQP